MPRTSGPHFEIMNRKIAREGPSHNLLLAHRVVEKGKREMLTLRNRLDLLAFPANSAVARVLKNDAQPREIVADAVRRGEIPPLARRLAFGN